MHGAGVVLHWEKSTSPCKRIGASIEASALPAFAVPFVVQSWARTRENGTEKNLLVDRAGTFNDTLL